MILRAAAAQRLVPVILAGGSGTRLWPVSRAAFPKHLVELFGSESLLQATTRRMLEVAPAERIMTVAAAGQAVLVRRQLTSLDPDLLRHILLEPSPRNTAAAMAYAALHAAATWGGDSILWVCPSDHLMQDLPSLFQALDAALPAAAAGWLVTFGITPSRPETGFGWIAAGPALDEGSTVRKVARFVEKPPREKAEAMLADGGHLWNSGMFVLRADRLLEELETYEPELLAACRHALPDPASSAPPDAAAFALVKSTPIDKAVMERSDRVAVVPADPKWSDVGSWHAIWELMDKDTDGNAAQGDAILVDSRNNLVRSEKRLVALAGVDNLAVIETADALLVVSREHGESIRGVVAALNAATRPEATIHAREVRPWGTFLVLQQGPGFRVREVTLDPGQRQTLQQHPGRDETWVIVAGTAMVELDGETRELTASGSIRIPRGQPHRLANPGQAALRLIEIGYGEALGDEDTVRLEN